MMNKTLALVARLTLPIAGYGKTVGTTSLGFDFGAITSDHKNASSVDGYHWDFGLNFNISNKDSYGLDLALDFAYSSDVNNEDYVSGLPGREFGRLSGSGRADVYYSRRFRPRSSIPR